MARTVSIRRSLTGGVAAPASLPAPDTVAESGHGLGLVRSVVDELSVQPIAGGGNRTVFVKRPR